MKKIILLLACLALILCACGSPETAEVPQTTAAETQPAETQAPETQPQETEAAPLETEAPMEATEPQNEALELAKTCIDKSVEELYALVGEPESADYAPSCLGDGEDGNLYYDGFIVYTYREGNTETVRYVE